MSESIYMPDGKPVPTVLLEADVVRFLRLDELGIRNPSNTLKYYREIKALTPTRIGNRNVYTIQAVMEFLKKMTKTEKGGLTNR